MRPSSSFSFASLRVLLGLDSPLTPGSFRWLDWPPGPSFFCGIFSPVRRGCSFRSLVGPFAVSSFVSRRELPFLGFYPTPGSAPTFSAGPWGPGIVGYLASLLFLGVSNVVALPLPPPWVMSNYLLSLPAVPPVLLPAAFLFPGSEGLFLHFFIGALCWSIPFVSSPSLGSWCSSASRPCHGSW